MKKYKYLIFSLICFLLFLPLMFLAGSHAYFPIDLRVASWVQTFSSPLMSKLMVLVSFPGYGQFKYLLFIVVAGTILFLKKKKEFIYLVFAGLGVELLNIIIKHLVGRERPASDLIHYIYRVENSASFPSGHVMYYVGFFGFLFFLTQKLASNKNIKFAASLICLLLVTTVGVSRIYLGAHWFSDVLGAYLAGFGWLFLSIFLYNRPHDEKS